MNHLFLKFRGTYVWGNAKIENFVPIVSQNFVKFFHPENHIVPFLCQLWHNDSQPCHSNVCNTLTPRLEKPDWHRLAQK